MNVNSHVVTFTNLSGTVIRNPLQTMADTERNEGEKTKSNYKIKCILIFLGIIFACALLGYVIVNHQSSKGPGAKVSVEQRERVPQRTELDLDLSRKAKITAKPDILSQGTSASNVPVLSHDTGDSVGARVPRKPYFKASSNKNFVLVTSTLTWKAFIEALKTGDAKIIEEFDSLFNSLD